MSSGDTVGQLKKSLAEKLSETPCRLQIIHGLTILKDDDAGLGQLAGASPLRVSVARLPCKPHATVHRVNVEAEGLEAAGFQEAVTAIYPDLLHAAEHGDLIENVSESGYRMDGVYIVFKRDGECRIEDLDTDVEEHGGIPAWVNVMTELPLNYWDLDQVDVKMYGSVAADPGEDAVAFNFHTEDDHAPIGLRPGHLLDAKSEKPCQGGVEFELNGQVFKIMEARSLDDIQFVVIGSSEPNVGSVFG